MATLNQFDPLLDNHKLCRNIKTEVAIVVKGRKIEVSD